MIVAAVFYFLMGFDEIFWRYQENRSDPDIRFEFNLKRRLVRGVAITLYLLYCSAMEASRLRGTLGKWVLGIAVVSEEGKALQWGQALGRNAGKPLSFFFFGLGCLWILWSRKKRAWHDSLADTYVINVDSEAHWHRRSPQAFAEPPATPPR